MVWRQNFNLDMWSNVQVIYGAPEENAILDSEQIGRMMVISTNSVNQDDGARQPAQEAQELDDTFGSQEMPEQPGTEILSTLIEQKRQLADICNAIRTLRGGMVSQGIGPSHLRESVPQGLGASNHAVSCPVPDLKNMEAM
jgi:hypothetical protein